MAKNGREKGAVAEREVAEIVRAWWSKLEPECRFVRTPSSGGWGTPELRGHFQAAGDLMTTAARWPFAVEVKRREKEWSLPSLLNGLPTGAWGWWRQAQAAALEQRGVPMLWMRKSKMGWLVLVPEQAVSFAVGGACAFKTPDARWHRGLLRSNKVKFGELLPVLYLAETLLSHHPRVFAKLRS